MTKRIFETNENFYSFKREKQRRIFVSQVLTHTHKNRIHLWFKKKICVKRQNLVEKAVRMRSSQNETQSKPKGVYSIDQILGTHNRQNNNTMGKWSFILFISFDLAANHVALSSCFGALGIQLKLQIVPWEKPNQKRIH